MPRRVSASVRADETWVPAVCLASALHAPGASPTGRLSSQGWERPSGVVGSQAPGVAERDSGTEPQPSWVSARQEGCIQVTSFCFSQ